MGMFTDEQLSQYAGNMESLLTGGPGTLVGGGGTVTQAQLDSIASRAVAIQPGSPPTASVGPAFLGIETGQSWWQNAFNVLEGVTGGQGKSPFSPVAGFFDRLPSTVGGMSTPVKVGAAVGTVGVILAATYGLLQAAGVRFPWEKRTIVDPSGATADVAVASGGWKVWATKTVRADGSIAMTAFAREPNGRMHSVGPDGTTHTWMPRKSIIMPRGKTTLSQAVTAQRYLDKMWKNVAKKTKQLKLA